MPSCRKNDFGDKVEKIVVSNRIEDSPCVLVTGQYGESSNMVSAFHTVLSIVTHLSRRSVSLQGSPNRAASSSRAFFSSSVASSSRPSFDTQTNFLPSNSLN